MRIAAAARKWAGYLFVAFFLLLPIRAHAAPYGGTPFGNCAYGGNCPAPVGPPAEPPTDTGKPVITKDVDGDGNLEQATDSDNNPDNGYEQYTDPDGSSQVLASFDGEGDGQTSYIIDTDKDGQPDVYWSPADDHTSPVIIREDQEGLVWLYKNTAGADEKYVVRPASQPGTTTTEKPVSPASDRRLTAGLGTDNIVAKAYDKIGEAVQKVPAPVAYSFPYLLLAIIVALVARLLLQTRKELKRIKIVLGTIEREKELVTEKENFLMLASHYLRTPLTIIKGNIELMQSLKQIADETANKLQLSVAVVMEEANGLLARLESNQGLARITKPQDAGQVRMKSLMSPLVIGPIILVFGLMTISHFLFIDFRVTNPNLIDFLVQVGLGILLAQLFISKFRAHQINIKNRQDQERLLEEQRELDKARNDLISNAGQRLSGQVARFGTELEALGKSGIDTAKIRKGYDQLKVITNKFVFATQLEADTLKLGKQQFNSDELINIVISHKQPAAEAKHVTINAEPGNLMLIENQGMLNIVLDSLIDNAVKYSEQQGQVNVRAVAEPEAFRFVVEDHGKGLSERQLSGLFKPFSRAESAETFDTEGLGFSLYLDKLIMHYLGGDIAITSVPGQGTQAQVLLPVL